MHKFSADFGQLQQKVKSKLQQRGAGESERCSQARRRQRSQMSAMHTNESELTNIEIDDTKPPKKVTFTNKK